MINNHYTESKLRRQNTALKVETSHQKLSQENQRQRIAKPKQKTTTSTGKHDQFEISDIKPE